MHWVGQQSRFNIRQLVPMRTSRPMRSGDSCESDEDYALAPNS